MFINSDKIIFKKGMDFSQNKKSGYFFLRTNLDIDQNNN